MPQIIFIILLAWIPVSLLLFWRLPRPQAVLLCFLGGWLLLPTAAFIPPAQTQSANTTNLLYLYMPAAIPADYSLTKATAIGLGALLASLVLDRARYRQLRFCWFDLAAALWCIAPLWPFLSNRISALHALHDFFYLFLAWGVPYLLGRVYFKDPSGHRLLARGIILAALFYLPLCAIEFVTGPIFYHLLYGFHPYAEAGMVRYIGYRPVGFLEDGNQLGLFLAGATLLALWLWRSRLFPSWAGIPAGVWAAALLVATLAAQSVGAILLLAAGLSLLAIANRFGGRAIIIISVLFIVFFVGLRAASTGSLYRFAKFNELGRTLVDYFHLTGRNSLPWRLNLEEQHIRSARQHLLTGFGTWNWFLQGPERPWGLWLLILGMYGTLGMALVYLIIIGPAARFAFHAPARAWKTALIAPSVALAVLLLMAAVDSLLNAAVILPWLLCAGALSDSRVSSPGDPDQGHTEVRRVR